MFYSCNPHSSRTLAARGILGARLCQDQTVPIGLSGTHSIKPPLDQTTARQKWKPQKPLLISYKGPGPSSSNNFLTLTCSFIMAPTPEEIAAYNASLTAAMLADSPEAPLPPGRSRKRKRLANVTSADATGDSDNDEEDDDLPCTIFPGSSSPQRSTSPQPDDSVAVNRNTLAFARQYATHKRLKPSQISEVEAFAGVRH